MKKYKLFKSDKFKKLLCGGLAIVMLSSIPIIKGLTKNKDNYDDITKEATTSYSSEENINDIINDDYTQLVDEYILHEEKDNKNILSDNINNSVTNNATNNATINYVDEENHKEIANNEDIDLGNFNDFVDSANQFNIDFSEDHIYNSIINESSRIENALQKKEPEKLNDISSYRWYVNGKIDKEKLIYNLTTNIKNNGIEISSDLLKVVNALSDAIIDDVNLINKKYPNYNFKVFFQIIDNLTIRIDNNLNANAFYSIKYKNIKINLKETNDYDTLIEVLRHEVAHALQDAVALNNEFGIDDYYQTVEQPLRYSFLYERFADSFAMEAMGKGLSNNYQSEEEKLIKLCTSTGKNIKYFEDAIFNHDHSKLTDCFEPEYKDSAPICLKELDFACGYGSNDLDYRSKCYDSAMLRLYKNACVRLAKDFMNGKISKEEFDKKIIETKDTIIGNCNWDYQRNTNIDDCIDNVSNVWLSFGKVKTK